jgi:hypothetical protein
MEIYVEQMELRNLTGGYIRRLTLLEEDEVFDLSKGRL